ncbi:hypothetical protein QJS10_CPB04g01245 [Acorus calamus]|uniref:Uncharacterized protein n=1 Tax=Acorus calamus TaxID=4465 RepID=A0AAV9F1R3_ACOCL|nr:hypothetical protein QJS10_CPB04g01245 [Acorus calamus]
MEDLPSANRTRGSQSNAPFDSVNIVEDIDMADECEGPINRDGDNEDPFTYLILLVAKWKRQKDTVPFIQ